MKQQKDSAEKLGYTPEDITEANLEVFPEKFRLQKTGRRTWNRRDYLRDIVKNWKNRRRDPTRRDAKADLENRCT